MGAGGHAREAMRRGHADMIIHSPNSGNSRRKKNKHPRSHTRATDMDDQSKEVAEVHWISSDEEDLLQEQKEEDLPQEQDEESPIIRRKAKSKHVLDSDDDEMDGVDNVGASKGGDSRAYPEARCTDETIVSVDPTSPARDSLKLARCAVDSCGTVSAGTAEEDEAPDWEGAKATDVRSCAICTDAVGTNGGLAKMPCPKGKATQASRQKHEFCIGCIVDWAKASDKCPLCREQFGRNAIIRQDWNGKQSCISLPPLQRSAMDEDEDEEQDEGECVVCDMRGFLIICDHCNRDYCLSCSGLHNPHNVPDGQWICRQCRRDGPWAFGRDAEEGSREGDLRARRDRREERSAGFRDNRFRDLEQGMMEATMAALNGGGVAGGRARLSRESRAGSGASSRGSIAAAGSSSRALTHQSLASTGRFGQSEAVGGGGQGRSPFGVWMHAPHDATNVEGGSGRVDDEVNTEGLFREADQLREALKSQSAAVGMTAIAEAGASGPQKRRQERMSNCERLRGAHRALMERRRDAIRVRHDRAGAMGHGSARNAGAWSAGAPCRVPIGGAGRKVTELMKAPRNHRGADARASGCSSNAAGCARASSSQGNSLDGERRQASKTSRFFASSSTQGAANDMTCRAPPRNAGGPADRCHGHAAAVASTPHSAASGSCHSLSLLADLPGFSSSSLCPREFRPPSSGAIEPAVGGGGGLCGLGRTDGGSSRQPMHEPPTPVRSSGGCPGAGGGREGDACVARGTSSPATHAVPPRKSLPSIPRKK